MLRPASQRPTTNTAMRDTTRITPAEVVAAFTAVECLPLFGNVGFNHDRTRCTAEVALYLHAFGIKVKRLEFQEWFDEITAEASIWFTEAYGFDYWQEFYQAWMSPRGSVRAAAARGEIGPNNERRQAGCLDAMACRAAMPEYEMSSWLSG